MTDGIIQQAFNEYLYTFTTTTDVEYVRIKEEILQLQQELIEKIKQESIESIDNNNFNPNMVKVIKLHKLIGDNQE